MVRVIEFYDSTYFLPIIIKENTMPQAKQGDTVQIHYTGKLDDGTVFDTSRERHPLRFTLGKGQVIAGFEQAVVGMNTGEFKTAKIPVEQAYGQRRTDMIVTIDRNQLPSGLDPKIGQRLEMTQADDQNILVTVTGATDSTLTLDANHPLAGQQLTFDIELIGIVE
jgi:peptidylprolyl isomerase